MIVKTVPVTQYLTTNTYFYIDEQTQIGFLIDPAAEADKLLQIISENNWNIEKILLTHGHFDHIGAVQQISDTLQIPYFIIVQGEQYLTNPQFNLSIMTPEPIVLSQAQYLNDGDIITLSSASQAQLKIIATPGHTSDSAIYYDQNNKLAFVGDTIFKDSYGATHFPGGDFSQLMNSIKNKILTLPEETLLYPGHEQSTSVTAEKVNFK